MTDQTPDPWEGVKRYSVGAVEHHNVDSWYASTEVEEHSEGNWLKASEVNRALTAERAQHQQEIANRVREVEHWVTRYNELEQWRVQQSVTLARRDETIRQLQDAFARCQEVQQATAETWRIEHDQMADQTEQVNEKWLERIQAGLEAHDRGDRSPNADMFVWESVAYLLKFAAQVRERDAQIARLSAEVEEQRSFEILMIKDATRLEAARDEAVSEAATLRAERDAAQQQIATLTQELSVSRANHIDANQRNMQSVRELEAAEARCATLQGAVAADEERLRQAAARAGVLFVGCDTADALADRCATLTAALEQLRDCDWTIGRGDRMDAVRDIARNALSGVPTP